MKKLIALMLVLALAVGFAACGAKEEPEEAAKEELAAEAPAAEAEPEKEEKTEEPALSSKKKDNARPEEAEEAGEQAEEEAEAVPEEANPNLIGSELPEITGHIDGMEFTVNGVDLTTYWDEPVLRIWASAANGSKYLLEPRDFEGYSIIAYQNGEELDTCLTSPACDAEYNHIRYFYPGTCAQICIAYQLLNESDPLTLWMEWDEGEAEYEFDVVNVCGAPAEPVELAPVTDTEWFQPAGDVLTVFGVDYTVEGVEVVDGSAEFDGGLEKVLRVTYKAYSQSDKDTYVGTPFKVFQDGLESRSGSAGEKSELELSGAYTIHPGETVVYTKDYCLRNMDPVFFLRLDIAGLYGKYFTLE